jgi:putative endonuclease
MSSDVYFCKKRAAKLFSAVSNRRKMAWKVYILKCADNSLYCGTSNDIKSRIAKHNAGKGAKYTKSRLPAKLVASSCELSKSDAFKLEYYIKQQPANKKIQALKNAEFSTLYTIKSELLSISKEIIRLSTKLEKILKEN